MQDAEMQLAAFDGFDMPVVRFDQDGIVTYMNDAAYRLLGRPATQRLDLHLLFPDNRDYVRALDVLRGEQRFGAGALRTEIRRPWREREALPVPVRIYAMPYYDAGGQRGAMIALLKDLREDEVRQAIHRAIARSHDNDALFTAVATQVQLVVPFDEFHITVVGEGRTRMRELWAMNPQREFQELVRWWTLPDSFRTDLPDLTPEIVSVAELLASPDYAELVRTDESTAAFVQTGVRQFISLPVRRDNEVVAFVALYSHQEHSYTREDLEQLLRLPLAEATLAALHRDRDERLDAVIALLDRLGQHTTDLKKVADELVTDLRTRFDWDHVSIFQHDDDGGSLRLVCQDNAGARRLPADFAMDIDASDGPIAAAARRQQTIHQAYDHRASPFGGDDPPASGGSQLALPIAGARTCWVLYVESRVQNAFAEEEIEPLEILAKRAAALLAHSALFELQNAVLQSIGDAVIETSGDGRIRWCNAAAKTMLGIEWSTAPQHGMDELAADEDARAALLVQEPFYHREANLRPLGQDTSLPFLLSGTPLPAHLGGRVFVASDFTSQREVQRLDALKTVFRQAAMEGRVPLAVAASWLAESRSSQPGWAETVAKVLRQLARADLPLERLLRLSSPVPPAASAPSDLREALQVTLEELPKSLMDGIEANAGGVLPVALDFNDLQFCVESMISFGLRTRPESSKLQVWAGCRDGRATLRVDGDWSAHGEPDAQVPGERWRRKTLYDLTLGDSIIARIVEQASGSYKRTLAPQLALAIDLPLTCPSGT